MPKGKLVRTHVFRGTDPRGAERSAKSARWEGYRASVFRRVVKVDCERIPLLIVVVREKV